MISFILVFLFLSEKTTISLPRKHYAGKHSFRNKERSLFLKHPPESCDHTKRQKHTQNSETLNRKIRHPGRYHRMVDRFRHLREAHHALGRQNHKHALDYEHVAEYLKNKPVYSKQRFRSSKSIHFEHPKRVKFHRSKKYIYSGKEFRKRTIVRKINHIPKPKFRHNELKLNHHRRNLNTRNDNQSADMFADYYYEEDDSSKITTKASTSTQKVVTTFKPDAFLEIGELSTPVNSNNKLKEFQLTTPINFPIFGNKEIVASIPSKAITTSNQEIPLNENNKPTMLNLSKEVNVPIILLSSTELPKPNPVILVQNSNAIPSLVIPSQQSGQIAGVSSHELVSPTLQPQPFFFKSIEEEPNKRPLIGTNLNQQAGGFPVLMPNTNSNISTQPVAFINKPKPLLSASNQWGATLNIKPQIQNFPFIAPNTGNNFQNQPLVFVNQPKNIPNVPFQAEMNVDVSQQPQKFSFLLPSANQNQPLVLSNEHKSIQSQPKTTARLNGQFREFSFLNMTAASTNFQAKPDLFVDKSKGLSIMSSQVEQQKFLLKPSQALSGTLQKQPLPMKTAEIKNTNHFPKVPFMTTSMNKIKPKIKERKSFEIKLQLFAILAIFIVFIAILVISMMLRLFFKRSSLTYKYPSARNKFFFRCSPKEQKEYLKKLGRLKFEDDEIEEIK